MHKKLFLLFLAMLMLLPLFSCASEPAESIAPSGSENVLRQSDSPSPKDEPFVEADSAPVKIEFEEFYLQSITAYLNSPSVFGDKALASSSNTYRGETRLNCMEVDLNTREETELPFYAFDPRADEENYYWTEYIPDSESLNLNATRKANGEKRVLYTVPDGYDMIPRLAYGDGYLVWIEYPYQKEEITQYRIHALDCKTGENFLVDEVDYTSGSFFCPVINNGYVAYADKSQDGYVLKGYDLHNRTLALELSVKDAPMAEAFDGSFMVWDTDATGSRNLQVYRVKDQTTRVIDTNTAEVDIYRSRYIIYCKSTDIYVYDMGTDQTVFTTETEKPEKDGKRYTQWFLMDKSAGRLVINGYVKGVPGVYSLAVLTFTEADG
ncbi:MAG: hypothetical protein ACERKO_10485 [Acetanaerobacterium sp.]